MLGTIQLPAVALCAARVAGEGQTVLAVHTRTLWVGVPASGNVWNRDESYLVDPASSHMLVSKIKPCMSKYKLLYGETANGSLNQLSSI